MTGSVMSALPPKAPGIADVAPGTKTGKGSDAFHHLPWFAAFVTFTRNQQDYGIEQCREN
jgi:hypothetical protein